MANEESGDEEVPFYRRADCVCAEAGGAGYGGLGPSELKRLRLLEEENRKLKQLVADLSLDKAMLQEVVTKKL